MEIITLTHPVGSVLLTRLRQSSAGRAEFRRILGELTRLLVADATQDLTVGTTTVETPLGIAQGATFDNPPVLIPVLRAGLGMLDAALELLPESEVAFAGVRRHENAATGEVDYDHYFSGVPADLSARSVLVLDPALATGGTLVHTCGLALAAAATSVTAICVLASPEGVAALAAAGSVQRLVVAAIDSHLDAASYIVPGLGDAGDRLYGNT